MQDIKVTIIWLTLIGLSFVTYLLAQNGYSQQVLAMVILGTSWYKGQLIIDHFMELRRVKRVWRLIISLWLIIILSVILTVYWISS